MTMAKLNWITVLIYHFILIEIALSLALPGSKPETKETVPGESTVAKATVTSSTSSPSSSALSPSSSPVPSSAVTSTTTTTELPVKAGEKEGTSTLEVVPKAKEAVEKPVPKKRGILEELYHNPPGTFDDSGMDQNDEPTPEELFSPSHQEMEDRPFYRFPDRGDAAFASDDGYFESDGRRKRTAILDGMYNRGQEYSRPEIDLSPDEVMALLNLLEERRLYNSPGQSPWSDYDNTVDSIEADMLDEDAYRDRSGNRFDDMYESNFDRYPTGMRYAMTKRKYLGNPKLKVPIFRRAIL